MIGAGSAGCIMASRLSEDAGVSVLLLEAGQRERNPWLNMPLAFSKVLSTNPRYTWRYLSEPEPALGDRRMPARRGRMLGGTSGINGMIYARGNRRDYDDWAQAGLRGWSYADVLPYFKRLESHWRGESEYHGGSGPIAISQVRHPGMLYEPLERAAAAAGVPVSEDLAGAQDEGVSRVELTVGHGQRSSVRPRYLEPALTRPNLSLQTGVVTTRVLLERGRAVGVEYIENGALRQARAAREVIVSCGAFNSPHLLMLSGIGPADHLRSVGVDPIHDLPSVGANLVEHPNMAVQFRAKTDRTFLRELRLDRAVASVAQWHLTRTGAFSTNGGSANILLKTHAAADRPDIQLVCNAVAPESTLWFPGVTKAPRHSFYARVGILYPQSRGWVRLRSANVNDPPRILYNLFRERADVDTAIRGVRRAREIYRAGPLADLLGDEMLPGPGLSTDAELAQAVREHGFPRSHALGSCAMGAHADAVVDGELRVRGVEALRVVDASVIPSQLGGNINVPVMMIAEKAADLIRGRAAVTSPGAP